MEATQNKKNTKKLKNKKKEWEGSTTILYSTLLLQSSTCTSVCRELSCCTCITMWVSLHYRTWLAYSKDEPPQKRSRSSWASNLDGFYTLIALCASACCMAIPTPRIISYIWLSLAYYCPHWCEPFSFFDFLPHHLLSLPFKCQLSCSRSCIAWVLKVERERISLTCTWLVVWGWVQIRLQRRPSVKLW